MRGSVVFAVALALFFVTTNLLAQNRDVRAQRLVLDDNGADSSYNTITIQAPFSLSQDVVLTIPDPGTGTAELMLSGAGNPWLLGGNIGTIPGTYFLGTTDSVAFQIQVRGGSGTIANSLILNENGSLQRDTTGDARGLSAIDLQIARSAATQVAASDYSVIGGGQDNSIIATADHATIAGGGTNLIRQGAVYSTIGGGFGNKIDTNAQYAVIGAGKENAIGTEANYSTIGGGEENAIDSTTLQATIGGGRANLIGSGSHKSAIGGGWFNRIKPGSRASTIAGGESNLMKDSASFSTIFGGASNRIGFSTDYATIGGGVAHEINDNSDYSTIGGGYENLIDNYATNSSLGGGRANTIHDSTDYATIPGGRLNGIREDGDYSAIGGGWGNVIDGQNSVIPGGRALTLNADRSFGFLANGGSNNMTISESDVAVFGNANLWLANNTGVASQIRFYEPNTATGGFPGTNYYTSFEAPGLGETIEYVLPAAKPSQTGEVLKVSSINGNVVSLKWELATAGTYRDVDVPTAIATPDGGSGLEIRMKRLESQIQAREQLLEAQKKQIQALCAELHALKEQGDGSSSEEIESTQNANVRNANVQNAE